jgi:hypothetical protein
MFVGAELWIGWANRNYRSLAFDDNHSFRHWGAVAVLRRKTRTRREPSENSAMYRILAYRNHGIITSFAMRFRKLRIAWSAICGVLCLLILSLLMRSYRAADVLDGSVGGFGFVLASFNGVLTLEPRPHAAWGLSAHVAPKWRKRQVVLIAFDAAQAAVTHGPPRKPLGICVPHWLAAILAVVLAPAPWLGCRFTLRTLLIAITLVAVVLGLVVWVGHK